MSVIVEAKELSRWYGIVMGLNSVSFRIEPGLTGLVGPNGAGKSTLIQLITGQLRPSSGKLEVLGYKPWNNRLLLRNIGFCPEKEAVHEYMTPIHWLRGLAMISGFSKARASNRAEEVLEVVQLSREHWSKRMSGFSKGMRQRVKLAQALMHYPRLLVLDEPMNGLDPMGRKEYMSVLKDLAAKGTNVIISSHILHELEALCPNILILNWGRILASGNRSQILENAEDLPEQLSIICDDPKRLVSMLFEADLLSGFLFREEKQELRINIKEPARFYESWVRILLDSGVRVFEISSENRSLSQIFDKVTQ